MKTQDPIEKQIKQRLDGLQRSTDTPSWSAVSQSLERRKKQKAMAWLWSSIGVVAILAVIFIPRSEQSSESDIIPQESTVESVVESTQENNSFEENDAQEPETSVTETEVTPSNTNDNSNQNTTTITNVESDFTKGAEAIPTYYYYDSETGQQVSTSDIRVIDSLVQIKMAQQRKDSLR